MEGVPQGAEDVIVAHGYKDRNFKDLPTKGNDFAILFQGIVSN
jgi:hypothetical protein